MENTIVEVKNIYTSCLTNLITPCLYDGIKSVYNFALKAHIEIIEKGKFDPNSKSPGVLKLFQSSLKEIPTLNSNTIEVEVNRIKSESKGGAWFDNLVKAVVKTHITLLTYSPKKQTSQLIKDEYHNKIDIKDFVHKCYIETARVLYSCPELFWHEYNNLDIQKNQRKVYKIIKQCIVETIIKILPLETILQEYLRPDLTELSPESSGVNKVSEYVDIKDLENKDHKKAPEESSSSETKLSEKETEHLENEFLDSMSNRVDKLEQTMDPNHNKNKEIFTKAEEPEKPKGSIPRIESDEELQKILQRANSIIEPQSKTNKTSKQDDQMVNDIHSKINEIKSQNGNPEKNSFFEHYRK